ncbi:general transcription factor II-I repeat domain-containing protein 2A-like [Sipha flava]|uniref:General transcription factor II-I repeat domain-containing protein 2A-like n=1 Tax=Sipha flava TaxID=143950 RepID=A0A8B8G5Y5_9HEMI|nr:general transcription factor II-I repeat domain-containing protein 2A-like [Sipha flava]
MSGRGLKRKIDSECRVFNEKWSLDYFVIYSAATKASFRTSHLLAKRGKAFSDGSLIKECIIQTVEEICPERIDTFKNISLSGNTVTRRIDDITLDESTDVSDTSQLLLFIRGVNKDLEISNELLSENLKCITTDGGRNMCGTKKGVIGQIFTNCEKEGFKPMTLHSLDLSCVMDPIISTVNFIRLSELRHRQFQDFLKEIETEYQDIPCDIEKLPSTLQMEMINLQSNDALKIKHREETLVDFYKFFLDIEYPNLKKFAIKYISVFATTYLCKQTFSKMKYIKSKYRSAMTDKHLESILKIGTSNIQPQFDRILAEKHQFHTSH